jgi:uncharacterized peroxidase-related enzyme
MAHINLNNSFPGIVGLMMYRPETAKPLNELVNILLRSNVSLQPFEAELIASYVSHRNDCKFCASIHGAMARAHMQDDHIRQQVFNDPETAAISPRLKALLQIAAKVRESGLAVKAADIDRARAAGATDLDVHDTVLIAAMFCMFNRYVDGLGTFAPDDSNLYDQLAGMIVQHGYDIEKTAGGPPPQ